MWYTPPRKLSPTTGLHLPENEAWWQVHLLLRHTRAYLYAYYLIFNSLLEGQCSALTPTTSTASKMW